MFLKNLSFGVDFKLQVLLLMYKINKDNINGGRNYFVILIKGL